MSFKLFIEPAGRVAVNVVVTFVQVALSVFLATGAQLNRVALASAVGAGLSAVWNLIIKPALVKGGWLKG